MKLSIIILNYNDYNTTAMLLKLINGYECINHIIVVDNKSTENDYERLQSYCSDKTVVLQAPGNNGYSAGNNVGIKWVLDNTSDELIAISNGDVEFDENFVNVIKKRFETEMNYDIITGLQYSPEGELAGHPFWPEYSNREYFRHIISGFRIIGHIFRRNPDREYALKKIKSGEQFVKVGAVEGSLFFIRRNTLEQIGLLDENVFIYREEDILAKKIKKINKSIGVDTTVSYIHYGAQTTQKVFTSTRKANYIYNSSVYFFNTYQSDNSFLRLLNRLILGIVKYENIIIAKIRKNNTNG